MKNKKVGKSLHLGCVFGHDIWKTALIIWDKQKVLSYWLTSFHRKTLLLLLSKQIPSLCAKWTQTTSSKPIPKYIYSLRQIILVWPLHHVNLMLQWWAYKKADLNIKKEIKNTEWKLIPCNWVTWSAWWVSNPSNTTINFFF